MSDCNLGELLCSKLKVAEQNCTKEPEYQFPHQPRVQKVDDLHVPHVKALILLREALGCTVSEANWYLKINFPKGDYGFAKLGEMIHAYYHR